MKRFRVGKVPMKRYRRKAMEYYERMLAVTQEDIPGGPDAIRRYYRKNLLPRLPQVPTASILDLGCGRGFFLEFLREMGYDDLLGVDICEEHVRSCVESGMNVTLEDNMRFLEKHPERFDCVTLNHVLEHYDKEEGLSLLESVRDSVRPGGRIVVVCPNMGNPFTAGRGRYADLTHETGYSEESLRFILQLAGFEGISLHDIDIYCLSNPVINTAGRVLASLMFLFMRIIYLLNGVRSTSILSKNMLAVAEKPGRA
jgi:O-antigen chain-terminating methyltransferase